MLMTYELEKWLMVFRSRRENKDTGLSAEKIGAGYMPGM